MCTSETICKTWRNAVKLAGQRAPAVVDDKGIAPFNATTKGNDISVLPHLGGNCFSRIDRRCESNIESGDERKVVFANGFEYGPAGDSVGAQAVQDRFLEAGLPRQARVCVQRISIPA